MTEAEAGLRKYLEMTRELKATMSVYGSHDFVYLGMEDLLLKHGSFFTPQPLPKSFKPMTPKHCFDNVYKLCRRYTKRGLRYVEGFADMGVMAMHHAWAVTSDGKVIDPTWEKPGRAYYGVTVPLDRVQSIRTKDHCSVLDDWPSQFKILREPFQEVTL